MVRPEIAYCTTKDGVSIAYYIMGDGPPLVIASDVLWSHLRIRMIPEYHRDGTGLGRYNRIVRYDSRGTGLSDRRTLDYSLDARIADIEGVVDHIGLERFDLLGFFHGGPGAIAIAAGHPDRVDHLVLRATYAAGAEFLPRADDYRSMRETVMDEDWERYTLLMANSNTGFTDSDFALRLAAVYRESMTPEGVHEFWKALETIDVRPLLGKVAVPTLAMYSSGSSVRAANDLAELLREIAPKISGARLAQMRWDPSSPTGWGDEDTRIVEEFLGVAPELAHETVAPLARPRLPSGMTAILFADIVDSTALTERMGDAAFREKARELDGALRSAIREAGGTAVEGKLLGDGVLAVFTSARQAIEAALRCGKAGSHGGLPLHLGIHAGDVIREENNVYGGAVNIAARIAGLSAPGEVLVSETVRSLARTSAGVSFVDRGEQSLKGVSEAVRVWRVRGQG